MRALIAVLCTMLAGCLPVPEQCRPRAGAVEQMFAPEQSRECKPKPDKSQDFYINPDEPST